MDRLLQLLREYPAVVGITLFTVISLGLLALFASLMLKAGLSLKPLVFFAGFLAIVAAPQGIVHLLDALAHRRGAPPAQTERASPATASAPIPWATVFGPDADPALITDAKRGLDAIFGAASEATISFNTRGESATAARFASSSDARRALDVYGSFFQFANATGADETGFTGRRYGGSGEWNHVVTVGNELYAWTGASKESVEGNRARALGAIGTSPQAAAARSVSTRLSKNTPVMVTFLVINVCLAAGWFFKASAWSARVAPSGGTAMTSDGALRARLLALNDLPDPVDVRTLEDGRIEVTWRYADARWLDLMRAHRMTRTHRLVLEPDDRSGVVRVREYWSAFDASAGLDGLRFDWKAATGMQFFQVEHRRVFGVQLDESGAPTGDLSATYTFDLQALKRPLIEAVTGAGWTWQPVMWSAPESLRWITE